MVLDLEQRRAEVRVLGLGTHALGLAGGEVAGEHAAVAAAGKVHPGFGFFNVERPGIEELDEAFGADEVGVEGDEGGEEDGGGELHGGRGGVWGVCSWGCLEEEDVWCWLLLLVMVLQNVPGGG